MNCTAMIRIMLLAAVVTAADVANVNNIPRLEDNITPRQAQQQCNPQTEQQCTRCTYGKDGAPIPEYYCAPSNTNAGGNDGSGGCPVAVCCNVRTEETCYDETTEIATSCARCVLCLRCTYAYSHCATAQGNITLLIFRCILKIHYHPSFLFLSLSPLSCKDTMKGGVPVQKNKLNVA